MSSFLKALTILSLLTFVYANESYLYAQSKSEEIISAHPEIENCDAYYQKALKYTHEAENIKVRGLGIADAAEKGGLAGTAAAFASLYQACLLRQNEEKAP